VSAAAGENYRACLSVVSEQPLVSPTSVCPHDWVTCPVRGGHKRRGAPTCTDTPSSCDCRRTRCRDPERGQCPTRSQRDESAKTGPITDRRVDNLAAGNGRLRDRRDNPAHIIAINQISVPIFPDRDDQR